MLLSHKEDRLVLRLVFRLAVIIVVALIPEYAFSHGIAGKRFFPTTFGVEDPFVSDEFSLLYDSITLPGAPGGPQVDSSAFSAEYSRRITPDLGISLGGQYGVLHTRGDGTVRGFGNLEVTAKYQFFTSAEHETILSFGLSDEVGNTGNHNAGAEPFSVISPALFFGKGFGDLPDSLGYLRPLAITGVIGPNFPLRPQTAAVNDLTGETEIERNPTTLTWAFTLQYSLMYLQSFVKDLGLGEPWNRMVLVVELPMETCLNRGCDGQTTETVNPGIVWIGKRMELGIAAQVPVNDRAGKGTGVFGLVHLFLDDLFPKSIGRPLLP